jgi:hypothetical protein
MAEPAINQIAKDKDKERAWLYSIAWKGLKTHWNNAHKDNPKMLIKDK